MSEYQQRSTHPEHVFDNLIKDYTNVDFFKHCIVESEIRARFFNGLVTFKKDLNKIRKQICTSEEELQKTFHNENKTDSSSIEEILTVDQLQKQFQNEIERLKLKIENQYEFLNNTFEKKIELFKQNMFNVEMSFKKKSKEEEEQLLLQLAYLEDKHLSIVKPKKKPELQKMCDVLSDKIGRLQSFQMSELFTENETFKINERSIGIKSLNQNVNIKSFECDYIDLGIAAREILQLSDKTNLVSQSRFKCLFLFDSNFKQIRQITIDVPTISMSFDTNYIYTAQRNKFIKFNLDLAMVEMRFVSDYKLHIGSVQYICAYNDRVYACMNYSLFVLTDCFDFIEIVHLPNLSKVFQIRILNDVACVSCCLENEGPKTCFMRLPNFDMIVSYDIVDPVIAVYGDYFLTYNAEYICCYDSKGNELSSENVDYGFASSMTVIEDNLLICLKGKQSIAKINLK